ncbi:hypothetical protein N0V82_009515 [Gnomoniopsis sp. IMI 355080]|nr:hypothetical protein N0V82_009515 [Gnomoniopsis sp. IMI 355080]
MSNPHATSKELESSMAKMTVRDPDPRFRPPETKANTQGTSIRDFAVPASAPAQEAPPERLPSHVVTETKNQDTVMEDRESATACRDYDPVEEERSITRD